MKAYLKELQSKLLGTVTDSPDVLGAMSVDASIFQIEPEAVVYPNNTADVRKTVAAVAERAALGKPTSLVPRGLGTDLGGGPLGEGVVMVFPAHMNKLLRLDRDSVTVQPGINYKTLQQTLHTHGRFLPPAPASIDYSTVGGAVSNNAAGEKSLKYGSTRNFVKGLKVVLADGTLVQTHRLSARELNRKKGLSSMEGEIYRKVDSLILDHPALIKKLKLRTSLNAAGYGLAHVKAPDGSFDLSQLFVGAQGTLGVITEVVLSTAPYNPRTTLITAGFSTLDKAQDAITKIRGFGPSAMELVDRSHLEFMQANHTGDLTGLIPEHAPRVMLFVEFDEFSQLSQKVRANRTVRLLSRSATDVRVATDPVEQVALWKIRNSSSAYIWQHHPGKPALPFIEDAVVPPNQVGTFLDKAYKLMVQHDLEVSVWGSAGDGRFHMEPRLDLEKKKDQDKLFRISHEFYEMVIALGGSTTGAHGDGLLRSLYLPQVYGEETYELFASLKHAFDPHGIFNPMKKTGATEEYSREHIKDDYSLAHFFDHLVSM